jgi:ornithine decarboxylase
MGLLVAVGESTSSPDARPAEPDATPVLRVDCAVVQARYRRLAAVLPGVDLHYAVKANPSPPVLRTLAGLGARWDVASPGEIDAVLAIDPDPGHLSYGNPIKKAADIAAAARRGVRRYTVDSPAELAKVSAHAPGAQILVRLSTSGAGADWPLGGKFGCPEREARTLLRTAAAAGHEVGISFHVGTQQRDPGAWDGPLAAAGRLDRDLRGAGARLSTVNLGGGFPAGMLGRTQSAARYGQAIRDAVRRAFGAQPPALMAEPGRFLVADAGTLVSEVVLVSHRGGERWVYLDAGLFTGLVEAYGESLRYRLAVERTGGPFASATTEAILAGPTCDSLDVLYRRHRYRLPADLRPGDRVHFLSAGAYTASYSTVGFNGFAPLRVEFTGSTGAGSAGAGSAGAGPTG